jgi:hypothetical protein
MTASAANATAGLVIGGSWETTSERYPNVDPATGEVVAQVGRATAHVVRPGRTVELSWPAQDETVLR